jgi:RNA polymerase sigma factor (sigma-70 family)
MQDASDTGLLKEYAESGAEGAFAELVQRHINLVYSAALRHVGMAAQAEEITQAVFVILARKAGSLRPNLVLESWLYETTRLTSLSFLRGERRRQFREQEAHMQSTLQETADDPVWKELAPLLDEAISKLGRKDRDAVVLRFFKDKSVREVAAELNVNEAAAQRRVLRAVDKLRKFFASHGVSSTTAIIGEKISAHSVQASPTMLAKAVAVVAVAKGAAASGPILLLVTKTMKTMTWWKTKFAVGIGGAALLTVGVATIAVSRGGNGTLTAREIAKESQDAYAALTSYSDTGKVVASGGGTSTETTFSMRLQRPNLFRVEWTQTGGFYTSKGLVWGDGTGNFFVMDAADKVDAAKPQKVRDLQGAIGMATGVSSSAASDIPGTFFNQAWGNQLASLTGPRGKAERVPDEKVGDTDCYVLTRSLGPVQLPRNMGSSGTTTTRLWIGKQDHLIHQIETTTEGASTKLKITDDNARTMLERQGKTVTPEAIAATRAEIEKSLETAQGKKFVFLQTHENISVNQNFTATDFAR